MNIMLDKNAFMPERAHDLDAGYDLRTPIDFKIHCRDFETIDTGVHVEIPKGYVGFLKSKSGLNIKDGITGEGVIDAGYTGSIKVKLYNNSFSLKKFKKGDKIIQLVILPIFTPEEVTMDLEVQADKVYPAPDHKYLTLSVEVEIELLDGSRVKGFYNFRNKCWYINKLLNFEKQRTVKKIKGWRY